MKSTLHLGQRMSQRGITKEMVSFVVEYGQIHQNKYTVNRREAQRLLGYLRLREKALQALREGGSVV